jgi:hypothetical protein
VVATPGGAEAARGAGAALRDTLVRRGFLPDRLEPETDTLALLEARPRPAVAALPRDDYTDRLLSRKY